MSEIKVTNANFEAEVLNSDVPVLVDFWATWCGPCKMLAPTIAEIAEESDGSYKVAKCDTDENMELAQKYRISSIPALLVFKDGQVVNQGVGYMPKEAVLQLLGK